jgi:cytochrome P450
MVCPPAVHLNPDIYPDPLTFNPSRFKVCRWSPCDEQNCMNTHISGEIVFDRAHAQDKPEINRGSRHFMAFGGGLRFCVGADFSKLQMSIFLHFLVTRYRYHFHKRSSSGSVNTTKKRKSNSFSTSEHVSTSVFSHDRWKNLGGGKIVRSPGLEFPDGYHVQIRQCD